MSTGEPNDYFLQKASHRHDAHINLAEDLKDAAGSVLALAALALVGRYGYSRCLPDALAIVPEVLPKVVIEDLNIGLPKPEVTELPRPPSEYDSFESLISKSKILRKAAESVTDGWERKLFASSTGKIQLRGSETGALLHERLRAFAIASFNTVRKPTEIVTMGISADVSKIIGIDNSSLVSSSWCIHETPFQLYVGVREPHYPCFLGEGLEMWRLRDLGRELTEAEKHAIYDYLGT
jgi:hypothetical protein